MRSSLRAVAVAALTIILLAASCSGSSAPEAVVDPGARCEQTAADVVERLGEFLDLHNDSSPEQFLDGSLEGLTEFQDSVAEIIGRDAPGPASGCSIDDLEAALDEELDQLSGRGLLSDFIVDSIRNGGQRTRRDLGVSPGDDLASILGALDHDSTITFAAGTYEIDTTLLLQHRVTFIGADAATTIVNSTAPDAAIAVFDAGQLNATDITLAHIGEEPASVLLAFRQPVDLRRVTLSGALVDDDGGSGAGLVLSGDDIDRAGSTPTVTQSTIRDSTIVDNDVIGLTVTGDLEPAIIGNTISANGDCGICLFDSVAGEIRDNVIDDNGIGIALQGTASSTVEGNSIGTHPVGLSMAGSVTATVRANNIEGAEIGMLIGGSAAPSVDTNTITNSAVVALLHDELSAGVFADNEIAVQVGTGLVVRGTAAPSHERLTITGGEVGVAFLDQGSGTISSSVLRDQIIALEVGGTASPEIGGTEITGSSIAAVVFRSSATGVLRDMTIRDFAELGVQVTGAADPVIERTTIDGGEVAISFIQNALGTLTASSLNEQTVAVQIGDQAMPLIEGNDITAAANIAINIADSSAPRVVDNLVSEPAAIGIQVSGNSTPTVEENVVLIAQAPDTEVPDGADGVAELVGMLYADDGAGTATGNQILGPSISIQVADRSRPTLATNMLDGGGRGGVGILYGGTGGGVASDNRTSNHQIGFQLSADVEAVLQNNVVETAETASFVLQGTTETTLVDNVCPQGVSGIVLIENADPVLDGNGCDVVTG